MGIDSGLFAQMGARPKSFGEYRQELDAQAANALALQGGKLQYQNALQAAQDDAAYREAEKNFGTDTGANINALRQRGLARQADAYQKSALDAQETQAKIGHLGAQTQNQAAQASKNQFETAQAKLGYGMKALQASQSPQQFAQIMLQAVQSGLLTQKEAAGSLDGMPSDPAQFAQWRDQMAIQGMDMGKKLELQQRAAQQAEAARHNKANEALTARGQNMTDARARESTAATMTKPFEVTGPDGNPVLVQQDKQGNITPVKGYAPKSGAEKPLTDAQSKSALFGARMEMANEIMVNLEKAGTTASIPGARMGMGIGQAISAMQSPARQMLDQAKRDFINATLRRESGAVINDSEFANSESQYFPQVGDSKEVIAQKRANREAAIRGVQIEIPEPVRRKVIDEIKKGPKPAATPSGSDPVAEALKKYGG